jgi:predicted PurR-regulated permease PerM
MSATAPDAPANDGQFLQRLTIFTLGLLMVWLVIQLLKQFADILQPLLIAGLIAYAILPPHRWLVRHGIRPALSYVLLLVVLLAMFAAVGQAAYRGMNELTEDEAKIERYHNRVTSIQTSFARLLRDAGVRDAEERLHRATSEFTPSKEVVLGGLQRAAGGFFGVLTFVLIAFVYLLFLLAEKITFDRRIALAFGDVHAGRIKELAQSINEAIINYIAVKMWISLVTALMSLGVFFFFDIEFAFFWGALIFLLNFIPYVGGIVAMAPPVVLAFLQHESIWPGVIIIALLTGIQLFTGQILEPRMAGSRLNLSPLLILLSLAFWGSLWGVPGMLLAVPLTVVIKIVLDHIPETRPIATLMSNL